MEELRSPPTDRARRRQIQVQVGQVCPSGARAEAGGAQAAVAKDEADGPCLGPRLLCLQLPPGLSPGSEPSWEGREGRGNGDGVGGAALSANSLRSSPACAEEQGFSVPRA